jgi:hypothetical protein
VPHVHKFARLAERLNSVGAVSLVVTLVDLLQQIENYLTAFALLGKVLLVVLRVPDFNETFEDADLLLWLRNAFLQVSALEEIRLVATGERPEDVDVREDSVLLERTHFFEFFVVELAVVLLRDFA